jgi:hypothetical protein
MRALAIGASALALLGAGAGAQHKQHAPPNHCQEDMPCWNCHTMGNHKCGRAHERAHANRFVRFAELDRVVQALQSDLKRHEEAIAELRKRR